MRKKLSAHTRWPLELTNTDSDQKILWLLSGVLMTEIQSGLI
jgi:hypothetical protein